MIAESSSFPKQVMETEWTFYSKQLQRYGLPLDNRKPITKLDWELWTASLASRPEQFQDLVHRLVSWADETSSRVPTTDYYDTGQRETNGISSPVPLLAVSSLRH